MSDARWQRVQEIFSLAVDLTPRKRSELLRQECGKDRALLEEVESLLAAADRPGAVDELQAWLEPLHGTVEDPSSPVALGPYEVERELGRGGMGIVHLARDPRLERRVAIKVLYPHLAADETMVARFVAEARAASSLDHANICTIHDLGRLPDGRFFIAMAYYPGGSLADRLANGPLAIEDALHITREVADGLHRTHEAGIVHRDIKPANIAFSAEGVAKILDFGVAKLASSDLTGPAMAIGTPRYMAPEQLRGEVIDRRSDIWSLAAVLYEMLAGGPAFNAEGLDAVRAQILAGEPDDLVEVRPEIPERVRQVIARGLARKPDERPQSARAFADQLDGGATPVYLPHSGARTLPRPPTRFLGRDRELGELLDLLQHARLVTLTGPAGTGKTRLAVEAAHRLVEAGFEVIFVQLVDLRDARLVAPTVAEILGATIGAGKTPQEVLFDVLARRRLVLVLDNLEHLPEVGPLLSELLERCPGLTLLTTSRGPLRLTAEHVFAVPPLTTGGGPPGSVQELTEAGQLFLDRARAVLPAMELEREDLTAVDEICRRLDGLPLAVELAAARVRLFSPRQILDELRQRIDLPGRGPRDHPERHRTLRQAIGWSHDLLSSEQRNLFQALSVFRGGFTLEQAAEVAALDLDDCVDNIDALLDQSLVLRLANTASSPRFGLLDTLRAYAAERLRQSGGELELRRRHRSLFVALAEQAAPELTAGDQRRWIDRLALEHDNLRAALEGGAEETVADLDQRLRLAAALWRFWVARGHFREGLERLEDLLASSPMHDPGTRVKVLIGAATLAHNLGRIRRARELLGEARSLCDGRDDDALLHILNNLAWAALEITDLEEGEKRSHEGLALADRLGDRRAQAVAHNNLGFLASYREDWDAATRHHRQSLALRRRVDDRRGEAFALINLSWARREAGDFEAAAEHLRAAEELIQALGDSLFEIWAACHRTALHLARDESRQASVAPEAITRAREIGNLSVVAELLYWQAAAAAAKADLAVAERLAEESLAVCEGYGWPWGEARSSCLLAEIATQTGELGRARSWWRRAIDVAEGSGLDSMAARARSGLSAQETG